jgi:hypothetical protein
VSMSQQRQEVMLCRCWQLLGHSRCPRNRKLQYSKVQSRRRRKSRRIHSYSTRDFAIEGPRAPVFKPGCVGRQERTRHSCDHTSVEQVVEGAGKQRPLGHSRQSWPMDLHSHSIVVEDDRPFIVLAETKSYRQLHAVRVSLPHNCP